MCSVMLRGVRLAGQLNSDPGVAPNRALNRRVKCDESENPCRIATSVMLGFRPATTGRVHPEMLGGLTFAHFTRTVDAIVPTVLTPRLVFGSDASTAFSEVTFLTQSLVARPHELVDNVPAATVGFNLAFDLTRHLALVPEVRAHVFSLNSEGPSAFVLRPGLAVRWMF